VGASINSFGLCVRALFRRCRVRRRGISFAVKAPESVRVRGSGSAVPFNVASRFWAAAMPTQNGISRALLGSRRSHLPELLSSSTLVLLAAADSSIESDGLMAGSDRRRTLSAMRPPSSGRSGAGAARTYLRRFRVVESAGATLDGSDGRFHRGVSLAFCGCGCPPLIVLASHLATEQLRRFFQRHRQMQRPLRSLPQWR